MNDNERNTAQASARQRTLGEWIQDPMGSVIAASALAMGSLGIVLSGIWFVDLTLS